MSKRVFKTELDAVNNSLQSQVTNSISKTIVDAKGDIVTASAADTPIRLAVGTNNQVLMADSATTSGLKWGASAVSTLTTTGDLLYASAANTPARLAIGSTDQVLKVSGGVPAWGAAPSPTAVGCYLYNSAAQAATTGVYTTCTFDSEYFDTDNIHSTSTNTSRLTVPTGLGGKWVVYVNLYLYSTTAGAYIAKFQVNGNDKNRNVYYHNGTSEARSLIMSQPFSLNAGDYVEVLLYHTMGANRNIDTDEYGGFGMMRVGA